MKLKLMAIGSVLLWWPVLAILLFVILGPPLDYFITWWFTYWGMYP